MCAGDDAVGVTVYACVPLLSVCTFPPLACLTTHSHTHAHTHTQVERTDKGKWLPVYTDVRKGRTQLITMVRKVSGNLEEMAGEMSKVCQNQEVRIKTGPRLEVKGRYTTQLRQWLAGLGF